MSLQKMAPYVPRLISSKEQIPLNGFKLLEAINSFDDCASLIFADRLLSFLDSY